MERIFGGRRVAAAIGLTAAAAMVGLGAQVGTVVTAHHTTLLKTTVAVQNLAAKIPGGIKKPGTP